MLRNMITQKQYAIGERLPPERELAMLLNVTRTLVREALIMLELEGLIEVRRGAGIYVINDTPAPRAAQTACNAAGPFEMLQARQLLESNIAEFAALQATREDIKMRGAGAGRTRAGVRRGKRQRKRRPQFPRRLPKPRITACWWSCSNNRQWREDNVMWSQLHRHLINTNYRKSGSTIIKRSSPP